MKIINYKEKVFEKKIQFIQMDLTGNVLFSTNNILKINKGNNLSLECPFVESIPLMLNDLETETTFSCVEFNYDKKRLLADVTVIKEESQVLLIIYDFTENYTHSNVLMQERNESTIKKNKLKQEKELLIEKEKLKNNFLANISHELRNPLSNMLGLLVILANSKLENEQSKNLSIITKTGWYLEGLLNDLLDISKINQGKLTISQEPFRMRQIATHLDEMFRSKREKGVLKFEIIVKPDVPKVLIGDSIRIKQILINILDNAFKHTQTGKVILTISNGNTMSKKVSINFKVEDTGIGIKSTETPKIFDEYYQVETLLSETKGSGLGLKIVQDLVNLQDGTIKVNSTYGKGTTFLINIPYKEFSETLKKKYIQSKSNNLFKNNKLLLVDDSEISQMILAKTLISEYIFSIDFAMNGEIALNMIDDNQYDLILLDINMPNLNGFDVLKLIKSSEKNKDIPILVLSGRAMPAEKEKALKLGAKSFITKPYKKKDLLKEIYTIISD